MSSRFISRPPQPVTVFVLSLVSGGVLPPVGVEGSTYDTIETLLIVLSVTLGIVLLANILTIGKVLYAIIVPHRL